MSKIHPEQETSQNHQKKEQIKHINHHHKHHETKKTSIMNQPASKFAAEEFDEKAILLCQFCGGKYCKQQDYLTNKKQPNAFVGLHSNWINDRILAMQRPSQRIIKQHSIYQKFTQAKIVTILNLQEPGEHPFCGDGLLQMVGFSYNPEGFFNNNFGYFNESWEDMTSTTFEHMMRIMNIFYGAIVEQNNKIAVHCHAGRGRTLLVINSWLIYWDRMTAKQTIDLAVAKREGVLTRTSQREFLYEFEQQLKIRWVSFGQISAKSFSEFVKNQKVSLLKYEQDLTKFKPYLHWNVMSQLRKRAEIQQNKKEIQLALLNVSHSYFKSKWGEKEQQQLAILKTKINNHTLFTKQQATIKQISTRVLVQLLYDFYDNLPFILVSIYSMEFLLTHSHKKSTKKQIFHEPSFIHQTQVQAISVMLDFILFFKQLLSSNQFPQQNQEKQLQKTKEKQEIEKCLFLRLSLLLCGKRKHYLRIFKSKTNFRQCKLLDYDHAKRKRYTSQNQVKLAQFLQQFSKQIERDQIDSIIVKTRKVDSNLHYYTKSHENKQLYFDKKKAQQIYNKSRI